MHPRPLYIVPAIVIAASAAPALAIFPKLSTNLTGPAIGGSIPRGSAKVDQSRLPAVAGRLELRIDNLNLPDGTVLTVIVENEAVATVTLTNHRATLATTLPGQVGAGSAIYIQHSGATVMQGGSRWQS